MDMFPQIRLITSDDYVAEIKNAIASHNYLSALVLSLMIPDICSKYDNKNNGNEEKKYIKWFNTYVYKKYYNVPNNKQIRKTKLRKEMYKIKFNGSTCYALRNAIFHSGNPYLIYKNKKDRIKANVDAIELCVNGDSDINSQYGEGASITIRGDNSKSVSIRINIVLFVENMISGYNDFLMQNAINKIKLFNLIDWDKIGGKIVFTPNN